MGRDSHGPPMSRFRAFTTSLGFNAPMSRSSSDQSSTPSLQQRPVSTSSVRSLYGNFTLFLRVHSALNLSVVAQSSYCKLYLGETPIIGGFGQRKSLVGVDKKQGSSHQTFHTKVQMSATRDCPEWNEKFQLNVKNPNTEILTIRVKNHVLLYSPTVGACVVHLRQVHLGETIDEWFPLFKNDKASGQIRLQICMQENVQTPMPERRYSQASEETIQRLMLEHRELEEANRRELEIQQQEKWKRMAEDAIKHAGLQEQVVREQKWREQYATRMEQEQQRNVNRDSDSDALPSFKTRDVKSTEDSDSDLPPSFNHRGVKQEEAVATQLMKEMSLQADMEENKERAVNPDMYNRYGVNSGNDTADYQDRRATGFGTIRLSEEELDQVVQNALPTSDSSDSTSLEDERRRRKGRDYKKRSQRKKHSKRRVYREDDSSDASSVSSNGYRKTASMTKVLQEEIFKKKSTQGSASSRREYSNQKDSDIPVSLAFPPSPPGESSDDELHRRRCRRAEKSMKRDKERKRRSKRKHAKSRRNYESSYSSCSLSSSSSSLSSSFSSSEEERLRRKLKKKKAKKARARAKLAGSGGSRTSTRTSGMQYSNKLSYADSRKIDSISPSVAQHWSPERADFMQVSGVQQEGQPSRPIHDSITANSGDTAPTEPATLFISTTAQQYRLDSSTTTYGLDGVGFDEPGQPPMPQYLGQTTKEQTNAELMRSFCF